MLFNCMIIFDISVCGRGHVCSSKLPVNLYLTLQSVFDIDVPSFYSADQRKNLVFLSFESNLVDVLT